MRVLQVEFGGNVIGEKLEKQASVIQGLKMCFPLKGRY